MGDTAEEQPAALQLPHDSEKVSDAENPQENRESGQSLVTPLDSKNCRRFHDPIIGTTAERTSPFARLRCDFESPTAERWCIQ